MLLKFFSNPLHLHALDVLVRLKRSISFDYDRYVFIFSSILFSNKCLGTSPLVQLNDIKCNKTTL